MLATDVIVIERRSQMMTTMTAIEIVQRAIEEARTLYSNPRIKRYKPELEKKHADKNHLYIGRFDFGRIEYLVSYPGARGDWSLSKSGLLYPKSLVDEEKAAAGIVLLMKGKIIGAASVLDVWAKVKDGHWFDRGEGEFTWVNANFEPTNSQSSSSDRYVDDPDEPY
jgi:hypothetical protein